MHVPERQQLVERIEEISIERVHVGDYVCLPSTAAPSEWFCVLVKAPIRTQYCVRVVGWQLALANGSDMWLPRGAIVQRRRFEAVRASASVRKLTSVLSSEGAYAPQFGRVRPTRVT